VVGLHLCPVLFPPYLNMIAWPSFLFVRTITCIPTTLGILRVWWIFSDSSVTLAHWIRARYLVETWVIRRFPVRFRPKPRELKSIWIWANRPSSKSSKLLFLVINANKTNLQGFIRHFSSLYKSAVPNIYMGYPQVPGSFRPKPRELKSIWIWANKPSSKSSKLLFRVIKENQSDISKYIQKSFVCNLLQRNTYSRTCRYICIYLPACLHVNIYTSTHINAHTY